MNRSKRPDMDISSTLPTSILKLISSGSFVKLKAKDYTGFVMAVLGLVANMFSIRTKT